MASSAPEYAFLTRKGISDLELKAHMLTGIRAIAAERSAVYAQRPSQPIYRVVVSAHGSDTVEKPAGENVRDVDVTFTFQQNAHGLPSFECEHGSTADLTNSDIRVKLYHIISQIVFEHPDISLDAVEEYQRHAFRWLYGKQLESTRKDDYEERFGDYDAKTFVEVPNAHHNVTRNYSILPGSLTADHYQLEYSDGTRQRVWLLPGISVARELVVEQGSEKLGIECNRITTEYGVFVDVESSSPGTTLTLNIFDIAQQLYSNPLTHGKQYETAYKTCCKVKAVKDRYDSDLAELNTKTKQMVGFISKCIIDTRGKKTPDQQQLEQQLKAKIAHAQSNEQPNNALMDELMSCIDSGVGIVSSSTKLVNTFFGKFNGNFDTWLTSKGMPEDKIHELIREIGNLKTNHILSDDGPRSAIFERYGITEQHARDIVIFMRKVFILSELPTIPFYTALPSLDISSDQIISILRLHCIVNKGIASPHVFIMDQVCRVCNSQSKCERSHSKTLGLLEVTTPTAAQSKSNHDRFKGGKCITKKQKHTHKHKHKHRNTRNTMKKGTYECKKYKVKKCKLTRRRPRYH
jgi:hypothetical protein